MVEQKKVKNRETKKHVKRMEGLKKRKKNELAGGRGDGQWATSQPLKSPSHPQYDIFPLSDSQVEGTSTHTCTNRAAIEFQSSSSQL